MPISSYSFIRMFLRCGVERQGSGEQEGGAKTAAGSDHDGLSAEVLGFDCNRTLPNIPPAAVRGCANRRENRWSRRSAGRNRVRLVSCDRGREKGVEGDS